MTINDITASEYNPYYKTYIDKVGQGNLLDLLYSNQEQIVKFFKAVPKEKHLYRYADDKWSILEVFQHIIDTERIFAYRAFRFARMDNTPLPGFEQDDYINPSQANNKSISQLVKEYTVVRQNSLALFQSLDEPFLKFIGSASGSPMSARAAMAIMTGHETHHIEIIKDRYLQQHV